MKVFILSVIVALSVATISLGHTDPSVREFGVGVAVVIALVGLRMNNDTPPWP